MLDFRSQANNIWRIYNTQEKFNTKLIIMRVLLLRYFRRRLMRFKIDSHRYQDIKKQESEFIEDMDSALRQDSLKMKKFLTDHLIITYKRMWEQTNKNIERDLPIPSNEEITRTVKSVWVGNKNFEQRQDTNTGKISDKLKEIFEDTKLSIEQKQAEMEKALTSFYNMNHRLMRTETIHIINESNIDCLKAGNFTKVMWVTADDEKVCPICNSRDNKVYFIDLIPTYPDHPNCRCVLVAVAQHQVKSKLNL